MVNLLVSELYRFQNAWKNDKKITNMYRKRKAYEMERNGKSI